MKKFFTRMLGVCSLLIAFSFTTTDVSAQCSAVPPVDIVVGSACYNTVITADPFCCNNTWDTVCTNAYNACVGGPATCPFTPPAGVVVGSTCYNQVTTNDTFCCNTGWDSVCQAAYDACVGGPSTVPNDLPCDAIAVSCGQTVAGTTVGATADVLGACGTTDGNGGGVWYLLSATTSETITLSHCGGGTTYDSKIRVFSGSCAALTCVDGNDDFCGLQSQLTFAATAGTNYYILVHGFGTATGAFSMSITCGAAPACSVTPPACVDTASPAYTTVTTNDPFCCNNSWDAVCQNAYNALNGSCLCAATPPTCVDILSNAYNTVISNDAFCCSNTWDLVCQAAYDELLPGNICTLDCPDLFANIGDPCFTGGPFPGIVNANCECESTGVCAVAPGCVDTNSAAYNTVINNDPFCCNNSWDTVCQNAYDFISGTCDGTEPCSAVVPECVDNSQFGTAYQTVIANDPFCCNNTWDTTCQNAYDALSNSCTGACIAPPACVDVLSAAYATVTANDPFCCNFGWDALCQGAYNELNGSCLCSATPPACVNVLSNAYLTVIGEDAFCCNNTWDLVCQAAYDELLPGNICTLDCPDLFANIGDPCFTGGPFPGIVNANCECESTGVCAATPDCVDTNSAAYNTVINSDSFCCNNTWDLICQNAYDALSTSCTNPVDCPALGLNIGDACDDGDANTENDTVGADCVCAGTPINPCNVDGGTVATASPRLGLCKGDGQQDFVQLTVSGNVGAGLFGIVRQSDLGVVASNTTGLFNIENLPAGNYFAGHVSVLNLSQLAGITNVNDLSGCFDLSNQLAVTSIQLAGGTISTGGVTTVCSGNVTATRVGNQGPQSRFVLLNQTATVVIAQNQTGVFNFTPLANGVYRIVSISFSNVNLATIIPPVLPACVVSSNLVTVTKVACPSAMLESSPNPTSSTSYVTFSVPTEEYTTLEVYDMSGRKVTELFRQVTEADAQYRLEFDGLGLPNGVYIYRLTTGTEVIIEKFMIAK